MTRVSWATLEPGQTENLLGVMICRENPRANRIRTSQGDGGIDILVPVRSDVVDVYQIKYFATRLDSSRKQQIKNSLARIQKNASVNVSKWYLALPLNPSREELTWFNQQTRDAPFECEWFGLDQIDYLAAQYQDVIDYYIGDGRDRLERSITELRLAAGIDRLTAGGLIEPTDIEVPLQNLYLCLNRDDPHYRYEFEVGMPRPPEDFLSRPGLVASVTTGNSDVAVTHHIFARYAEATTDAPVALSFQVDERDLDSATKEAWIKTLKFGSPSTVNVRNLSSNLPGGLGEMVDFAGIQIGPSSSLVEGKYELRLGIFSSDGVMLADALVHMDSPSQGFLGGVRATGTEQGGAFTVEILLDPKDDVERRWTLNIHPLNPHTVAPARLERGVRFLSEVHRPNTLAFGPEFGPFGSDPFEIPSEDAPVNSIFVELIFSLAVIQNYVDSGLTVPDLESLSFEEIQCILQFAALVRGETIRDTWESLELDIHLTAELPVAPASQLALETSFSIKIGDRVVTLEPVTIVMAAATFEAVTQGELTKITARPALGNDTRLTVRSTVADLDSSESPR